MITMCPGIGENPYTVNVVTFSGHGITFKGDAIAAIPEYKDKDNKKQKIIRFINFSDLARKFAQIKNTISIFILSMCRIEIDKAHIEKMHKEVYLDEKLPEFYEYKYLLNDS